MIIGTSLHATTLIVRSGSTAMLTGHSGHRLACIRAPSVRHHAEHHITLWAFCELLSFFCPADKTRAHVVRARNWFVQDSLTPLRGRFYDLQDTCTVQSASARLFICYPVSYNNEYDNNHFFLFQWLVAPQSPDMIPWRCIRGVA